MSGWKFWKRDTPTRADAAQPGLPGHNPLNTADTAIARFDAWQNEVTGLGTARDKSSYMTFDGCGDDLTPQECERLWTFEPLASKGVEKLPDEALRKGFEVQVADDTELADDVEEYCREAGAEEVFRHALKTERGMGGCAIFSAVDDGRAQHEPLDESRIIRVGSPTVLDCSELQVWKYQTDIMRPGFRKPEVYRLAPRGVAGPAGNGALVHASRLIVFPGIETTSFMSRSRAGAPGWGFSILSRIGAILASFNLSWRSAANLLNDAAQAILKTGAIKHVKGANGRAEVRSHLQELDMQRSGTRMMVLSPEDSYERVETPMSGIPDIVQVLMTLVSSALDTPVSVLFGDAPAGLNATGQADRKTFQDAGEKVRREKLKCRLERWIKWNFMAKTGLTGGKVPEHWGVIFPAFEQLSDVEEAQRRKTVAETDRIYFDIGLSTEEILNSRFGENGWSAETVVDQAARAALDLGPKEPEPVVPPDGAPPEGGGSPSGDGGAEDDAEEPEGTEPREDRVEKRGEEWALVSKGEEVSRHKTKGEANRARAARFAVTLEGGDQGGYVKGDKSKRK